jgi:hypothetical protein
LATVGCQGWMKAAGAFNGLLRELRDTMTAHIVLVSDERTEPHDRATLIHVSFSLGGRALGPYGREATCLDLLKVESSLSRFARFLCHARRQRWCQFLPRWHPALRELLKVRSTTTAAAGKFGGAGDTPAAGDSTAVSHPSVAGSVHAVGAYRMACANPIVTSCRRRGYRANYPRKRTCAVH